MALARADNADDLLDPFAIRGFVPLRPEKKRANCVVLRLVSHRWTVLDSMLGLPLSKVRKPALTYTVIGGTAMSSIRRRARFFRSALLSLFALAAAEMQLEGHAILKSSSPTSGGSITSSEVPVKLTFNVRVDATRSRLQLLMPDSSTVELPIVKWPSPDTLVSKLTGLKPGVYIIRWQVLAPDGHISRGEIPFTVR